MLRKKKISNNSHWRVRQRPWTFIHSALAAKIKIVQDTTHFERRKCLVWVFKANWTSTKVRSLDIEDIWIKTQGLKETWCFLRLWKAGTAEAPGQVGAGGGTWGWEGVDCEHLTHRLDDVGLSLIDEKMLLGRNLDLPSTGYRMTSKYNLTRMPQDWRLRGLCSERIVYNNQFPALLIQWRHFSAGSLYRRSMC